MFLKSLFYVFKILWIRSLSLFSSPGLIWDAMLKITGIKIEKISGIDKYLFIQKGLRGGISCIAKRCAKAKNYDPEKPSTFISNLDMNNLYG